MGGQRGKAGIMVMEEFRRALNTVLLLTKKTKTHPSGMLCCENMLSEVRNNIRNLRIYFRMRAKKELYRKVF